MKHPYNDKRLLIQTDLANKETTMKTLSSRLNRSILILVLFTGLLAAQGSAFFDWPVLNEPPVETALAAPQAPAAQISAPYGCFLPLVRTDAGFEPGAFDRLTPTDGATGRPTALTLDWGDSARVSSYDYCYDTTNDNACSNWVNTGATSQASISGLSFNTLYYWQVRAVNSFGSTYASGSATAFWSFTTMRQEDLNARQAVVDLWNNEYLASEGVADGWTGSYGSCNPGDTSQAFKDAVVRRINYFRGMAGVPDISGLNAELNGYAQAAALLMSRNNDLEHDPPASWTCYSNDAYTGASHSNIALGMYGPGAITGYMEDSGSGNYAAGHRRWLLNPTIKEMGSGDVPGSGDYWSSNALYVVGVPSWPSRPAVRDDYVAWPPKGYVPYQVVFRRWTLSYPGADFSNAQVTVTKLGANQPLTINPLRSGYGENTIVWEMTDIDGWSGMPKPSADTSYQVTVSNVLVGGATRNFSYEVVVIDPAG